MTAEGADADAPAQASDVAFERLRAALLTMVGDQRYSKLTSRAVATLLVVAQRKVPLTVRHVAAHLRLHKPAVSRALDELEGFKLVTRRKDPDDLRSRLIELTVEGDAVARRAGIRGTASTHA